MSGSTIEHAGIPATNNIEAKVNLPEWLPLKTAGDILAVSPLHVHILVRDGILRSTTASETAQVSTTDVLAYRPKARAAQEKFASDVARAEDLCSLAIEMCA
ncbi:hypothetical protein [Corynebacterium flavescens]|uniref:hypothetical protein n=1 Tax=Corynebacterium flavescens TaxID=28028 RepID=UPI003FD043DD